MKHLKKEREDFKFKGICSSNLYSASTILYVACDTRVMTPNANLVIHNPYITTSETINSHNIVELSRNIIDLETTMLKYYLYSLTDENKQKEFTRIFRSLRGEENFYSDYCTSRHPLCLTINLCGKFPTIKKTIE